MKRRPNLALGQGQIFQDSLRVPVKTAASEAQLSAKRELPRQSRESALVGAASRSSTEPTRAASDNEKVVDRSANLSKMPTPAAEKRSSRSEGDGSKERFRKKVVDKMSGSV